MECENISILNYSSKPRRSRNSISILVVDDDITCLSVVAALLKKLKYEVVTAKHPNDALCALRIKGGAFDLVVSDVHMPDMNGFELQEAITHEFNLPVVLMSVDSKEVVFSKGLESGAAFFISKPVSANDLKDLWQFASMARKTRHNINDEEKYSKRKSQSKDEGYDIVSTKKPKVIWTNALHYRFLEAIRSIGLERCVPKKILQVMNVPGLTRENVASHLQKYRIFLNRVSDASSKLKIGDDDDEGLISRSSSTSHYSSSSSSSSRTYSHSLHCFPDSATRFSYEEDDRLFSITTSDHLLKPNISIPRTDCSSQVGSSAYNYSETIFNDSMHQIDTASLDQCLGDSFYLPDNRNRQRLSSDVIISGDCQYHRDLNPYLVNDQGSEFSSLYDMIMATHQPSNPTHVNTTRSSEQGNIIQNQAQENQNGCESRASSLFYDNYHDDQAVTMHNVSFANELQRNDDDDLECLLAFGDDHIRTLEGI